MDDAESTGGCNADRPRCTGAAVVEGGVVWAERMNGTSEAIKHASVRMARGLILASFATAQF
jgi:hypothetical protein